MLQTGYGLPNTCSRCGKEVRNSWFAPNEDAARAGLGLCAECAGANVLPHAEIIEINLSDGVNREEASAAGKALAKRKKSKRG